MQLIEESSLVLRGAVANEIIDVVLRPFEGASIPLSMFGLVTDPRYSQPSATDPETFAIWGSDQTLRWQENSLPMVSHTPQNEYFALEVARFAVPAGQVGFIEALEQVVNDHDRSYFPTNQEYWGSPEYALSDVNNIRWYLKLDFFNGTLPVRYQANNTVPIPPSTYPGFPYIDLPEIDALWYPAHCNRRIKLVVPGNRILRLYVYSPPTTFYRWRYGGRLAGYTQSTYHCEAMRNARIITC